MFSTIYVQTIKKLTLNYVGLKRIKGLKLLLHEYVVASTVTFTCVTNTYSPRPAVGKHAHQQTNQGVSKRQIQQDKKAEQWTSASIGARSAPLLFNLYMNDMPSTQSQKFGYADDYATAAQHKNPKFIEHILSNDAERYQKNISKFGSYVRTQIKQKSHYSILTIERQLNNSASNSADKIQRESNLPRIQIGPDSDT